MASQSDILLLALLAQGESGVLGFANWGEAANSNFEFLEDALGEVSSIALAGVDVAMTAAQHRALLVKLTGTLTANVAVKTADRKGFWFVRNDTSGAFTVTFRTSSGTGIVVPQGASMLLVSDGTNVLQIAALAEAINKATSKTTPVDADEIGLVDSAASNGLKKLTWANLKAAIKTYYDSVTATLTNKTLSSPTLSGTVAGSPTFSGNLAFNNNSADTPSLLVKTGLIPGISAITGQEQGLQIENNGNASASAVMAFHRTGAHAVYFGLDTDNKMKIGGWSLGANAYPMVVLGSSTYNVGHLTIDGDITSTGNITANSDISLKEDIRTFSTALNMVHQLRGVRYRRKDTGKEGIGFIAQEVEGVLPELVHENGDGIKSVAYGNFVPVLVEAVKELSERVGALEGRA